jgi:hypothetical protein
MLPQPPFSLLEKRQKFKEAEGLEIQHLGLPSPENRKMYGEEIKTKKK